MRRLRCHHCGSEELTLVEFTLEAHSWDEGLVINEFGEIAMLGEAEHSPGDPVPNKSEITCHDCGRVWHPRRGIHGSLGGW